MLINYPSGSGLSAHQKVLVVEDEFAVANDLARIVKRAGHEVTGTAFTVEEARALIRQQKPDLVLLDISLQGPLTGIDLARQLNEETIPFVFVSAYTETSVLEEAKTTQPYGFLVKPFREKDVLVALEIAQHRHAHGHEARIREAQALQIRLTDAFSAGGEWQAQLLTIAREFQAFIPFDYLIIGLENEQALNAFRSCSFFRIGQDEYQTICAEDFLQMTGLTVSKYQQMRSQVTAIDLAVYNHDALKQACANNPLKQLITKTFRLQSHLMLPLRTAHNGDFYISFYSRQPDAYQHEHLRLAQHLQPSLTLTVDRLMAFDKIELLSEQLRLENSYLQEEVKTTANFEEIIGESPLLKDVFKAVSLVAPTDYTVLVLGETGTGKELIARAVHNRSQRRGKALIKINCAVLPPQLIESELFGHEKGSFTGALDKRVGKFELAHGGTIFLDEIGELPLELQPKLLRVLQEKEIERVGGHGPIPCDLRIIAATNRDLQQEVKEGRFRADLFYRLNVFPIQLPALRERKQDLPALTSFFLRRIAKKLGKKLGDMSDTSMQQMLAYHWPGNIRELEHLLERAAIMSSTSVVSLVEPLRAEAPPVPAVASVPGAFMIKSHEQAEREHLLAVLQVTNFRIRGKQGAAELLSVKPTTLEAKMAKLGIHRKQHT